MYCRQGALLRFGIGALRRLGDVEWHPESYLGCPGMASLVPGLAVLLDIGAEFGQGEHARGVNDNGIAQASNERKGDFRRNPNADGRVGLLQRLGPDAQILTPVMRAREGEALGGPRLQNDLHIAPYGRTLQPQPRYQGPDRGALEAYVPRLITSTSS